MTGDLKMLNQEDTSKFQKALEGPLKSLFTSKYDSFMTSYSKFRERVGPQCPFCKAAARTIFQFEVQRKGQDFLDRFKNGDWNGYD